LLAIKECRVSGSTGHGTDDSLLSPATVRVVLGTYLRDLRLQHGLRLADVVQAGVVGSVPTLSRIEKAMTPVRQDVLMRLLKHYGVTDRDTVQKMCGMLDVSRDSVWWSAFRDVIPGWAERLISVEELASEIRTYEDQCVPGLLQTPEYARALMSHEHLVAKGQKQDEETIDRKVQVRTFRQSILHRRHPRSAYTAIVDEAVLTRPIGGRAVFRDQLWALYSRVQNSEPRINVRIFPAHAWRKALPPGPAVTHLQFQPGPVADMVYLETMSGGTYLTNPSEVEWYKAALTDLFDKAATRQKSLELLRDYIEKVENDEDL
jgi:transcriptional regulator with XRE-family HTH domain